MDVIHVCYYHWKLFEEMTDNSIQVELVIGRDMTADLYNKLCQYIEQEHLRINKIKISLNSRIKNKYIEQLVDNNALKHLTFGHQGGFSGTDRKQVSFITNYMSNKYSSSQTSKDEMSKIYNSLCSIKLENIMDKQIELDLINVFLTMKLIVGRQLW